MKWRIHETGYSGIHSTKPQTLGYALTDSPVGVLPALSCTLESSFKTGVLARCTSWKHQRYSDCLQRLSLL